MFGPKEIIVVLVVLLIVLMIFGPKRFKSLGSSWATHQGVPQRGAREGRGAGGRGGRRPAGGHPAACLTSGFPSSSWPPWWPWWCWGRRGCRRRSERLGLWIGRARRSYHNVKAEVEREIGMDEVRRQLHNEQIHGRREARRAGGGRRPRGDRPAGTAKRRTRPAAPRRPAVDGAAVAPRLRTGPSRQWRPRASRPPRLGPTASASPRTANAPHDARVDGHEQPFLAHLLELRARPAAQLRGARARFPRGFLFQPGDLRFHFRAVAGAAARRHDRHAGGVAVLDAVQALRVRHDIHRDSLSAASGVGFRFPGPVPAREAVSRCRSWLPAWRSSTSAWCSPTSPCSRWCSASSPWWAPISPASA